LSNVKTLLNEKCVHVDGPSLKTLDYEKEKEKWEWCLSRFQSFKVDLGGFGHIPEF